MNFPKPRAILPPCKRMGSAKDYDRKRDTKVILEEDSMGYTWKDLADLADGTNPKAYAALCEEELTEKEFRRRLIELVTGTN